MNSESEERSVQKTLRSEQKRHTVRTGSAEARRHHELGQDSGDGAGAQEHRAAGAVGRQKHRPVPEGDQPERSFPQNCRQKVV